VTSERPRGCPFVWLKAIEPIYGTACGSKRVNPRGATRSLPRPVPYQFRFYISPDNRCDVCERTLLEIEDTRQQVSSVGDGVIQNYSIATPGAQNLRGGGVFRGNLQKPRAAK